MTGIDPDVAAVSLTILVAGALAVPGLARAVARRRALRRACGFCGRLVMHGERTCDCDS